MIQTTKRFKTGRGDSLHSVSQNLRFSNPNNMKWCNDDVIIVLSQSVYKTCQRQPTALKLGRLIVYSKFHKIYKFEIHVTRNDVITKNNRKQWENANLRRTKLKYISFKRIWWELFKIVTFIEFELLCQKVWTFMSSFTMTNHQIWSCHVTLAANFKNFYFLPASILNFRKVTKFGGNWLKNKKVTSKNPVLIGFLKSYITDI